MTLNEYQNKAYEFATYPMAEIREKNNSKITNLIPWIYPSLALAEEAGEVCGKLAKTIRDKWGYLSDEQTEAISKELGDVLWELSALATELGFKLDDIAESNITKLTDRRNRGVISGSGDNR